MLFKKATTSADEAAHAQAFVRVGPNPATDFVVVQVNVDANAEAWLTLSDVRGTQHRTTPVESWTGVGRLDVSGLSSGTYIVTLHDGRSVTHTTIQIAR